MSKFHSFTRATIIAAAAAFAAAAVAPAGAAVTDPPKAQEEGAKPEPKKARKYCVETEGVGSRLARKVCKTRAEWISEDRFDPAGEK